MRINIVGMMKGKYHMFSLSLYPLAPSPLLGLSWDRGRDGDWFSQKQPTAVQLAMSPCENNLSQSIQFAGAVVCYVKHAPSIQRCNKASREAKSPRKSSVESSGEQSLVGRTGGGRHNCNAAQPYMAKDESKQSIR